LGAFCLILKKKIGEGKGEKPSSSSRKKKGNKGVKKPKRGGKRERRE